jgi:hypothetical protein
MRHEDEKEKIRSHHKRIHTWDLLEEVDELCKHIPGWEKFEWSVPIQQKYKETYRNKTGHVPWNKKGN